MTILIDGRPFAAPSAGITNFLKGSIIAWARLRPEDRFVIALPRPMHPTLNITGMPDNILFLPYSNRLLRRLPNLVWLCCMMPWLTRRWRAEAYFSPLSCLPFFLPKRMKKGIVVHDVVNLEFKETMQWTNRLSNAVFFNRSIRKADFIWTNSQYTKGRVEHYFPKRRCNDIFVGCSVDRSSYHLTTINDTEAAAIKKRHGINNRFLLFVGSLEPRKNLSFLLSLMPQLYREHQLQLVVVGGHGKTPTLETSSIATDFPREAQSSVASSATRNWQNYTTWPTVLSQHHSTKALACPSSKHCSVAVQSSQPTIPQ